MQEINTSYPATFSFDPPDKVANWRPLVNWLLVIPHFVILYGLRILSQVVGIISWFVIVFTGELPESFANIQAMYLRYELRTYTYFIFMREEYPPFTFGMAPTTPVKIPVRASSSGPNWPIATASPRFQISPRYSATAGPGRAGVRLGGDDRDPVLRGAFHRAAGPKDCGPSSSTSCAGTYGLRPTICSSRTTIRRSHSSRRAHSSRHRLPLIIRAQRGPTVRSIRWCDDHPVLSEPRDPASSVTQLRLGSPKFDEVVSVRGRSTARQVPQASQSGGAPDPPREGRGQSRIVRTLPTNTMV